MDTLLGIGQAFELDRRMIPQAGVDAFAVVEAFDIACQAGIELSIAHEAALVRKLSLQGMEEALHVGIVLAVARSIHAGHDTLRAQERLVAVCGVLNAAVGVEHQSWLGFAQIDRSLDRTQGDSGGSIARDGPADNAPREEIHDRSQVPPVLAQTQVREVSHPDLIGARRCRLIQPRVARFLEELMHAGRASVQAADTGPQALLAHQPHHALIAAANALALKLLVNPRRAVSATAVAMNARNLGAELLVVLAAAAALARLPGVEPAP